MSRYLATIAAILAVALAGCSGESAKQTSSDVTRKAVEVTKGALSGVDEGIEQGRKAAESTDGARIVSTHDEFHDALTLEILAVKPGTGAGTTAVVFGLANAGENPVRVTGLSSKDSIIALDTDGYVVDRITDHRELTVPAAAKLKVTTEFRCAPADFGELRVLGVATPIPDGVRQLEPDPPATTDPVQPTVAPVAPDAD